jgi:hypothetical protein
MTEMDVLARLIITFCATLMATVYYHVIKHDKDE